MPKFTPAPDERRQFGRVTTSYHGWIKLPGRPPVSCKVIDLSLGGALLEVIEPIWVPYSFQLTIIATNFTSACEVRHQRGNRIGVQFCDQMPDRAGSNTGVATVDDNLAWRGPGQSPARR